MRIYIIIAKTPKMMSAFFFSSRRRHTRFDCDWSSDVCSSDLTGMVVGEVQEELGIPASTLSHHLEKLKQVGLVHVRRESTYLWYSADTDALREVMNFLYEECCTRSRAVPAESVVQISGRTS